MEKLIDTEAINNGTQIILPFPNSKMTQRLDHGSLPLNI